MKSIILSLLIFSSAGAAPSSARPGAADSRPKVSSASDSAQAAARKSPAVVVLSRAVGEVGEHVVTSREVRINEAIDQALSAKAGETPHVLSGYEKSFPAEVGKVLDEWIVFLEAKSLSSQPPTRTDAATAMKSVQEFWAGKPAWLELEVATEELRDCVERKLIAREFERLKSDPQLAPVTDEDALIYYRKNRLRFGSLPFASFKDNIKAFLIKQQTERRLAEWRDVLRRKYKVRNFIAG